MDIDKLNKLRDIVYRLLVIHLNIKEEPEVKTLIKSIVTKIDDEVVLKNLTCIKYVLNPVYIHTKELVIEEFSEDHISVVLLILKATKSSKYKDYSLLQLIDEFCSDYKYKMMLDLFALYTPDNMQANYIDNLFNAENWDDD